MSAHVVACQLVYSFHYGLGAGQTDGKAPGCRWVETNPLAPSTKEIGPGWQRNTLNCHFGDYNWRKVTSMGHTLLKKFKAMTTDMSDHFIAHFELNALIPYDLLLKWGSKIKAWEQNKTNPNPFTPKVAKPIQASVHYELAQAEAQNTGTTEEKSLDEHVLPSVLIVCGLEIESEQHDLKVEALKIWDHSKD
ncbi:hypothetical protein C0995_011726 [Termitomyces sp. Mi166|nr:hypothetical protein C0995_011726 [Termitomyces sp. Mi166\